MAAIAQGTEVRLNRLEVLPGYPGIPACLLFRHPYGRGYYGACTGRMRKIRTGEFAIEMQ
jgi:hypothetical protein